MPQCRPFRVYKSESCKCQGCCLNARRCVPPAPRRHAPPAPVPFPRASPGPVSKLRLLGDYAHSTRISFIEFQFADSAMAALNCSGALLGGCERHVRCRTTEAARVGGGALLTARAGGALQPGSKEAHCSSLHCTPCLPLMPLPGEALLLPGAMRARQHFCSRLHIGPCTWRARVSA